MIPAATSGSCSKKISSSRSIASRMKRRFMREAIDREYLIFFEHDPLVLAGYIREKDGKRWVEQVL